MPCKGIIKMNVPINEYGTVTETPNETPNTKAFDLNHISDNTSINTNYYHFQPLICYKKRTPWPTQNIFSWQDATPSIIFGN